MGLLSINHVALALLLLKCKPRGIVLEDYVSAIQASLTEHSAGDTALIDGTKLWFSLFNQIHGQTLDTQAELVALKSLQEICHDEQNASTDVRKSKRIAPISNKANTQLKRRKTEVNLDIEVSPDTLLEAKQHKDRSLILRILFGLARHPQGSPAQPDGLTHLICLACEAVLEALENADDTSTALHNPSTKPLLFNETCVATQQIWTSIVLRLRTASSTPGVVVDYDMIVPQICPIIQWLLGRLHHYCSNEAADMIRSAKTVKRSKKPNTKSATSRNIRRTDLFNHNCKIVVRCLAHIMERSNDIQNVNEDAFQCLAAIFLQHLGSSLSLTVFANPRSTSNHDGLLPPRGLSDTAGTDRHTAIQAAKLEAPHLVSILRAMMQHGSKDRQPKSPESLRALQELLFSGIFEGNGNNPSSLPSPVANRDKGSAPLTVLDNDGETNEFLSQVWDMLGWDIMLDKAQSEFTIFE